MGTLGRLSQLASVVVRQFDRLGPPLAGTVDARYWEGGDEAIERVVFESVRRIVAFGSDQTIDRIIERASAEKVTGYGDSFSVGFVADGADFAAWAPGAARDVCLFDQRGCLSPQTIYVEGDEGRALLFARALAQALGDVGRELPRARTEAGERAAAATWLRHLAVTAVAGRPHGLDTLIRGPSVDACPEFVVAVEPCGAPTRAGFGRIVSVKPCTFPPPILDCGRLDTVGVAGDCARLVATAEKERATWRVCALGEMQRPPFGYRPAIGDFT